MSPDCGLFMGKTTKAVVSCIVISIAILFSSPDLAKTILPTAVALQSHSVISINGNSGFTAANGVTSGTGTAVDPYVISGWDIDVFTSGTSGEYSTCIQIQNATAYFVVIGISVECHETGVFLSGVHNARIESSTISSDSQAFQAQFSTNLTLSGNGINGGTSPNGGAYSNVLLHISGAYVIGNTIRTDGFEIDSSKQVTFSGNSVTASGYAVPVSVSDSSSVTISNNSMSVAYIEGGLDVSKSMNLTILNNTIRGNISYGISLGNSNSTVISENRVIGGGVNGYLTDDQGIVLGSSSKVQIFGNNVTLEAIGIHLFSSTGNLLYHNNLVNNTIQAQDDQPGQNSWDNGYPSGGNFWSDYTGVDNCSGPQQNICPSPDGIGDTPYTFNNNQDNYPLMQPFVPDPPATAAAATPGGGGGGGLRPLHV